MDLRGLKCMSSKFRKKEIRLCFPTPGINKKPRPSFEALH